MRYWLIKSEPDAYSIEDLKKTKRDCWDGVRNYQARNFMRDEMKLGDLLIFYHSNIKPPCAVGVARVCQEAYADHTAWDPKEPHYDSRSSKDHPIWMMVDIEYVKTFKTPVSLQEMRQEKKLETMALLKKGNRLSIIPITKAQFEWIENKAES